MNQRHKHADLIIAWANGAIIQFKRNITEGWIDCRNNEPSWRDGHEYRIKPPPMVKVYKYAFRDRMGVADVTNTYWTDGMALCKRRGGNTETTRLDWTVLEVT